MCARYLGCGMEIMSLKLGSTVENE
jgi:hypothetical protein